MSYPSRVACWPVLTTVFGISPNSDLCFLNRLVEGYLTPSMHPIILRDCTNVFCQLGRHDHPAQLHMAKEAHRQRSPPTWITDHKIKNLLHPRSANAPPLCRILFLHENLHALI